MFKYAYNIHRIHTEQEKQMTKAQAHIFSKENVSIYKHAVSTARENHTCKFLLFFISYFIFN